MSITGDRIKESRENQGLSKTKLAEKTGLTLSAISQFESGERDPSLESLKKLADALQVSADYIMGIKEEISDQNILATFRGLQKMTEDDKKEMLNFMQFLKAKKEFKTKKGQKKKFNPNNTKLVLKFDTDGLGSVGLEVDVFDHDLQYTFYAEEEDTRKLITQMSVELKERMKAINYRIVKFKTVPKTLDLKKILLPTLNLDKLTRIVAEA